MTSRQSTYSRDLKRLSGIAGAAGAEFSFWASTSQSHLEKLQSSTGAALVDISEVLPGRLYLGSRLAAENLNLLRRLAITHIVLAHQSIVPQFPSNYSYHVVRWTDGITGCILQDLLPTVRFVQKCFASKRGRVLVHCTKGISRSATIVLACLMIDNSMTLTEGLGFVRSKRPVAYPNIGFQEQLKIFSEVMEDQKNFSDDQLVARMMALCSPEILYSKIHKRVEQCLDDTRSLISLIFDSQHKRVPSLSSGSTAASEIDKKLKTNPLRHTTPWAELGLVFENLNAYRLSALLLPDGEAQLRRVGSAARMLDGLRAAFYGKLVGIQFAELLAVEMRKWIDLSILLSDVPIQSTEPLTISSEPVSLGVCVNSLFRLGPEEPEDIAVEIGLGHGTAMSPPGSPPGSPKRTSMKAVTAKCKALAQTKPQNPSRIPPIFLSQPKSKKRHTNE